MAHKTRRASAQIVRGARQQRRPAIGDQKGAREGSQEHQGDREGMHVMACGSRARRMQAGVCGMRARGAPSQLLRSTTLATLELKSIMTKPGLLEQCPSFWVCLHTWEPFFCFIFEIVIFGSAVRIIEGWPMGAAAEARPRVLGEASAGATKPVYLSTYLPRYLPTYLPTCPPTYLPTYLQERAIDRERAEGLLR